MKPQLLFDAKATLGEGPVWDARTQRLYWIDILNKRIYAGADILFELDDLIGCIAPRKSGGFILTTRFGFASLDLDARKVTSLSALKDEPLNNRFNDGKCDPCGRFLAGTMAMGEKEADGSLYSFDGQSITKLLNNITISNGMTWSPDYKTFYFIDTPTREVRAFDYDLETGRIGNPHSAVHLPDSLGWPDGMTSDMQGNLWVAIPAKNVTSCTFGGQDLNELYITSARVGLDETTLTQYPLTGGVFCIQTHVEGMPTFEFEG
jgi:sugar lactone lactonase YvrE